MKTEKFKVIFYHNNGKNKEYPTGTTCVIKDHNDFLIANVTAVLYYKDKFCKKEGRKKALTKAMDTAKLTREERSEIWAEYKLNFKI